MLAVVPGAAGCFKTWKPSLLRPTISVMLLAARSISEKKKIITSPASPHRRPTSGIVDQDINFCSTMTEEGRRF